MFSKRVRKNRLVARARAVFFGLFALAVVMLLIVGNYIFGVISDDFSRRLSRQYSIEAAADFLSSTNSHFVLAHQLAHSTSVSRWVAHIDDADFMAEALDRIENYASFAPHVSLRVSFYDSFYTYYLGTRFTVAEFDFDRSVMREGPGREWFLDTRDAELPFNLNIQRSRGRYEHYIIYVWTNHRIYYEGRFVGVMTAGSPFSYVFDAMFGDFDADVQRGYIIDDVGMVRADSTGRLQVFDEGWSMPAPAPEAADNPEMVQALDAHLQKMQGGAFWSGTEVSDAITIQGDYRYASIAPIIGTNWSVAVLSSDTGIWGEQYALVAASVFVSVAVFVLISNLLLRKILVTPLYNLTQSTANIGVVENTELFGLERDDEIGDLARTIKQSQEAMVAAKYAMYMGARLTAMLDASPILCSVFDEHYNVIEVNQAAAEVLGLPDKQVYIDQLYDVCPEFQPDGTPSKDKVPQIISQAFKEGSVKSEWMHQTLDGKTQIPCEVYLKRVELEGSNVVMVYARDLREQMEILSKLKHREELLRAASQAAEILLAYDNGEDSMSAIAKGMEIVGRSVDADRVLLFKNETIDGEPNSVMLDGWIRDDDELSKGFYIGMKSPYSNHPGWFEMFSRGESINYPVSMLPPESAGFLGAYRVKSIAILPLFIGDEFFGRLSVGDCRQERTFSDLEMGILRSAGVMFVNAYHRMAQTAEIKAAIEKTEEANRAKTKFLSTMSHEMRTPMNSVLGIAELQLQKDTHPPETEEAFMRIHNSSNLLLSIINDILDLSKVEAGKMELISAVYETASIIIDTVQLNIMYIGSKSVELELSVDERLPVHLIGDELRIKQILNNLLSNAFKYTLKGTVKLSLSIQDNTEGDDPVLVIVVSDTGQGMTREQIDNLFRDEFIRFNPQGNRAIEGSGLGMAISYQLSRMMGGDIFVESAPGKGSVFTVLLPQKKKDGAVLGPEAAARLQDLEYIQKSLKAINKIDREPMPYGRVLVVDDVESNLHVAKGFLMPYKLAVETVASGEQAIEKINDGQVYDIIFMDYMMPNMDGVEATNIIRAMGYKHPIVALTANAISGVSESFMKSGFDAFVSKPIDVSQLDKCLLRFIRDKQPPEIIEKARRAKTSFLLSDGREARELHDELMHSFLMDTRKAVDILEPLIGRYELGADELKAYTTQVHAMKSALRAINRYALSEAAHDLEVAGRTADMSVIQAKSPSFLAELRELIKGLKLRGEATDYMDTDEDPAFLQEQLLVVKKACNDYDIKSADNAIEELNKRRWSKQTKAYINDIARCLLRGEFEEAAALINI